MHKSLKLDKKSTFDICVRTIAIRLMTTIDLDNPIPLISIKQPYYVMSTPLLPFILPPKSELLINMKPENKDSIFEETRLNK